MSTAQCQQLYEVWNKARLAKDKKPTKSSRALEARVATLEEKQTAMRANLPIKPKPNNRNNQPLIERKAESDRAMQITDGWGH